MNTIRRNQDYYAGGLVALLGAAGFAIGRGYPLGTLRALGPGFLPIVLSVFMVCVGTLIAANAAPGGAEAGEEAAGLDAPQWRGWACILGSVLAFVLLARPAGMVPATFACVFIAAMGDRTATVKNSAILAACVALAGVLVFHYALQIQLQPFGS